MIRALVSRSHTSSIAVPIGAVVLALLSTFFLLLAAGADPFGALSNMWDASFGSS